jgi:hypothetical protein
MPSAEVATEYSSLEFPFFIVGTERGRVNPKSSPSEKLSTPIYRELALLCAVAVVYRSFEFLEAVGDLLQGPRLIL